MLREADERKSQERGSSRSQNLQLRSSFLQAPRSWLQLPSWMPKCLKTNSSLHICMAACGIVSTKESVIDSNKIFPYHTYRYIYPHFGPSLGYAVEVLISKRTSISSLSKDDTHRHYRVFHSRRVIILHVSEHFSPASTFIVKIYLKSDLK